MGRNNYDRILPALENYRDPSVPDEAAFTWEAGLLDTGEDGIFKVGFTSQLNPETVEKAPEKVARVLSLDHAARLDAATQPGYRHYYADIVSRSGAARSFCLWNSAEEARTAALREPHRAAVEYAMDEGSDVYSYYQVVKSRLTRTEAGLYFTRLALMVVAGGKVVDSWNAQSQKFSQ